ncbi:MAG TPA: (d)CMP kinase [Chitinophagales bacterium]|nr:(d)CMP kinase [Chitinophagales bacterium]
MHPIIIAIDGPSSSGKSTLAKLLAAALNYRYIDSGAFYRATTVYFYENRIDLSSQPEILNALAHIQLQFEHDIKHNESHIYLNGKSVESEIRGITISNLVSGVSTLPEVRKFIVAKLRDYGTKKGVVMDGRDIGTVVFPEAELKIYMTADEKVRSERRYLEMKNKGLEVTQSQITKNLYGRDLLDSTRVTAPLKKADDAIVVDNTLLSEKEQFEHVLALAHEKIARR